MLQSQDRAYASGPEIRRDVSAIGRSRLMRPITATVTATLLTLAGCGGNGDTTTSSSTGPPACSTGRGTDGSTSELHLSIQGDTVTGTYYNTPAADDVALIYDYLGTLGDDIFSELTSRPRTITVRTLPADNAPTDTNARPMHSGNPSLRKTSSPFTDASLAYDIVVKVTNSTAAAVTTSVHQQVILYDANGAIVGGDEGFSDNQPKTLEPGASYQERWTNIPAEHPARDAVHLAWPE